MARVQVGKDREIRGELGQMYVSVKNKCEQEAGHNTSDYRYSMSGFSSWLLLPVPVPGGQNSGRHHSYFGSMINPRLAEPTKAGNSADLPALWGRARPQSQAVGEPRLGNWRRQHG